MKNLSPVWFIKPPIDLEYKYYILLDFLQSMSLEIKQNKVYFPVKKILSLIGEMDYFLKTQTILITDYSFLDEEDWKILKSHSLSSLSSEEIKELEKIITNSLILLRKYADLGINLWKGIEERIKIFNLEISPPLGESGITIFRNMSTDEVFSYWWKKAEIKMENGFKRSVMLKKIPLLNNYYSLSYEFIIHETLGSMGIRNGTNFSCTVIEISEDFSLDSEIFKIAKEKFIREIDPN